MPSTESSGSSSPLSSLGRSIWSFRREQVHSMEGSTDSVGLESEIESFQQKLGELFQDLSSVTSDELLSIPWLVKLLDSLLCALEDFKVILFLRNGAEVSKPPLDRLVDEFFERSVKALDICNAAREGVDRLRQWHRHLDIAALALDCRKRTGPPSEGQFRRARKTLVDLMLTMLDERDASAFSQRHRSFGRQQIKKNNHNHHVGSGSGSGSGSGFGSGSGHSRSHSWSVSHSWSAAKQLQAIVNSLAAPRANEVAATGGLAQLVYAMSSALAFTLWVLVAAIPCQDRGLSAHISAPRSVAWGPPLAALQGRISEEAKKRENKNSNNGLLREIGRAERCARDVTDLMDSVRLPLGDDQRAEVERHAEEIAAVCEALRGGLDPLEREIREVFRKIMACRTEGLDILNKGRVIE